MAYCGRRISEINRTQWTWWNISGWANFIIRYPTATELPYYSLEVTLPIQTLYYWSNVMLFIERYITHRTLYYSPRHYITHPDIILLIQTLYYSSRHYITHQTLYYLFRHYITDRTLYYSPRHYITHPDIILPIERYITRPTLYYSSNFILLIESYITHRTLYHSLEVTLYYSSITH